MADTSRLYTLEQVVQRAFIDFDGDETGKYQKFLQLAIEGWSNLRNNVIREGRKLLKVTPNAINRITFPQDMQKFIGLGVPVGGKIYFLTEKSDLIATYTTGDDGSLSLDSTDGEGVDMTVKQYETIKAVGGVNLYGYYYVDWDNDQIVISSTSRSELLLAYTTSGTDLAGETYVPTLSVQALVAYILWQDAEPNMMIPEHIVQRYEKRWLREKYKLHKADIFSADEFYDVLMSYNNLLNK